MARKTPDQNTASGHASAADGYVAYSSFAALLVSIFLLNGGLANALVIVAFTVAWIAVVRSPHLDFPKAAPLTLLFITAISLRLLLPPYGSETTIPGTGIARSILIVGLYGLTVCTYARVPFRSILLLIIFAGISSTALAIAAHAAQGDLHHRLGFLGRAGHPIFGAGAVATTILAAITSLVFLPRADRSILKSAALCAAIAMLVGAMAMTGSRGPAISLAVAIVATPLAMWRRSAIMPIVCAFGAWSLVTASVVFEHHLHDALCPVLEAACRPSLRQGVWTATAGMVAEHPLWGAGYAFRFEGVPHAHNALFGMALNYGLPLLMLFLALLATALAQTARMKWNDERFFVVACLIFASGFMGSDLSDPMRFFNTHYLFLWFPLILALISEKTDEPMEVVAARAAEDAAA